MDGPWGLDKSIRHVSLIGLQNGLNMVPTCRSLISQGSAQIPCPDPWTHRFSVRTLDLGHDGTDGNDKHDDEDLLGEDGDVSHE